MVSRALLEGHFHSSNFTVGEESVNFGRSKATFDRKICYVNNVNIQPGKLVGYYEMALLMRNGCLETCLLHYLVGILVAGEVDINLGCVEVLVAEPVSQLETIPPLVSYTQTATSPDELSSHEHL